MPSDKLFEYLYRVNKNDLRFIFLKKKTIILLMKVYFFNKHMINCNLIIYTISNVVMRMGNKNFQFIYCFYIKKYLFFQLH